MLKLQSIFEAQDKLDRKVVEVHGLEDKNLTGDVTHALFTELGELQQEIGYFKYWKKTLKTNEVNQREEWADCMHFLASLGNKYGHVERILSDSAKKTIRFNIDTMLETGITYHHLFNSIYKSDFGELLDYAVSLSCLLIIGIKLGMTFEDMEKSYFDKNQVNYDRLASGY